MFIRPCRNNCNLELHIGVFPTTRKTFDYIRVWQTAQLMNFIEVISCSKTVWSKIRCRLVRILLCIDTGETVWKCNVTFSGFHLSATVVHCSPPRAQFNVAVTFDRRRISSCNCTCSSAAYWCSHVVAVCLHRIHCVGIISDRWTWVTGLIFRFPFSPFSQMRFVFGHRFQNLWLGYNEISYRSLLSI